MPTIEDPNVVREIIAKEGHSEDGPRVEAVFRYYHPEAKRYLFMLAFSVTDISAMLASPYCQDIEELWVDTHNCSEAGKRFMAGDNTPSLQPDRKPFWRNNV